MTDVPDLKRINHGRGHSYRIGGQKVPGITTILGKGIPKPAFARADVKKAARYAVDYWDELAEQPVSERLERIIGAPAEMLSKAGARGTLVHKYAEQLQADAEVEVPDEYRGFVDAYLAFDEEWRPREVLVERPFFHVRLGYAGTPDLVADLADGRRWILDWKTTASGIWPEHALQLAAARFAEFVIDVTEEIIPVPQVDAAGAIHLRDDGSYELRPCEAGLEALKAFLYAKQVAEFAGTQREDWIGDALIPPPIREESRA